MLRFAAILTAAVLLSGFQAAPLPPRLAALADDVEAAKAFDYYTLKADGADMTALGEAAGEWVRLRLGAGPDWTGGRCMTPAEMELRAGLDGARLAADAAAFEADRQAAPDARARWEVFSTELLAGRQETQPPFSSVASWVREAEAQTDPRSRELLTRVARDQLYRFAYTEGGAVWGGGLSEGARSRLHAFIAREICEIDTGNTAWLEADVEANGWYLISAQGQGASNAAWLMAQHADAHPAFQRKVLALIEPLARSGEVRAANYAYLYDRVASGENRPQRYGTQGRCVAASRWEEDPLEDPARVDALRAEAGLPPLAEYKAGINRLCADFTG